MKLVSRLGVGRRPNEWETHNDDSLSDSVRVQHQTQTSSSSSSSSSERKRGTEFDEEEEASERNSAVRERERKLRSPPTDDCCPICFGVFVVPCRAQCAHWYCGSCILQYWNYGTVFQPCKCPMCSQKINVLTPEASLFLRQEAEVTDVLKKVQKYNRLFAGGIYSLIMKVFELLLFVKREFRGLMDLDRIAANPEILRLISIFVGLLYLSEPFDLLPKGRLKLAHFEFAAFFLFAILYLGRFCLWRIRFQPARELVAIQPRHA